MNLATVAVMLNGRASSTARHNALFRALEAGQPADRRVVDDTLARRFLGPGLGAVAAAGRLPGLRTLVPRLIDGRWPGVRTAVVARTRLIDDAVAEAMGAGGGQAVLLGAGFDTRAWRLPGLAGVPVFEVDHPATQAAKRRALPAVPPLVRLVPCDFAADDLGLLLAVAGLRPELPALVLWEGVTNYLDEPAVDRTLRWCAGCAPGSVVIMTYVDRAVLTDPGRYAGAARLRATLERVGERFTFGLDPGETPSYLADRGLALVDDVGAPEFRRRAYGARAEAMVGHEFYRVARAVVPER